MASGKCIICGKDVNDGTLVQDTAVIRAIRKLKGRFGMAQNNTLVVCQSDLASHAEKRKRFERQWVTNLVLAAGLCAILILLPLVTGTGFNLGSLILAPILAGLILLLPVFSYMPPLVQINAGMTAAPNEMPMPPANEMPMSPQMQAPMIASKPQMQIAGRKMPTHAKKPHSAQSKKSKAKKKR